MFSSGHAFLIIISTVLILLGVLLSEKYHPPVRRLICICLGLSLLSEVIKTFSNIQILPVVTPVIENEDLIYRATGNYTPYLEAEHMPFELCSYQIVFMFLALIIKDYTMLKRLYAFMYTTCIIGGGMGIAFSSSLIGLSGMSEIMTSTDVWRAFLFHSMLIVEGIYIGRSKECDIRFGDVRWTFIFLIALDCMTLYLNSIMATPYYKGDTLAGIGNVVNYFSSYNNPLGIPMKDKSQWVIYLILRAALASVLIILVNLPLLKKKEVSHE